MTERTYNVLFLCTGNSARSIMAEALLSRAGRGRFRAYSAGSFPSGRLSPYAVELLQRLGLPIEGLRSKSWDEFAQPGAPEMDFIITVCDKAANEVCPVWPGHPMTAHWGIPDPGSVQATEQDKVNAYREALRALERRIDLLLNLPLESIDKLAWETHLRAAPAT